MLEPLIVDSIDLPDWRKAKAIARNSGPLNDPEQEAWRDEADI